MTTIEPKPMDTADLEDLRRTIHPVTHPSFAKLLADRDYHEQRAEQAEHERDEAIAEIEVLIGAARKATGASADEEPEDVALHLLALCEELDNAEAEAADLWVAEQRVKDVEAERDEAIAEIGRLRARTPVQADDVKRAEVTWAHAEAWCAANGRHASGTSKGPGSISYLLNTWWDIPCADQWRILAEMVAMALESEP